MKIALAVLLLAAAATAVPYGRVALEPELEWDNQPMDWISQGRVDPNHRLEMIFAVRQQNIDVLERVALEISDPRHPRYGRSMSMEEVNAMVAPTPKSVRAVLAWLEGEGVDMSAIETSSNSDFVVARNVTVAQAERLVGAEYHEYAHEDQRLVRLARGSRYSVPAEVAAHLDFVEPSARLPRVQKAQFTGVRSQLSKSDALYVTPSFLRQLYQIPNGTLAKASNNSQCVLSFIQQYWSNNDLQEFYKLMAPELEGEVITQIGENKPSDPGMEASLDVQYLSSIGAAVPTTVWYTADANTPFLTWLVNASMSQNVPWVVSASYGEAENSLSKAYVDRCNAEFAKLAARSVSTFVASGDSGVGGNCSSTGVFSPDYPTSSPWVTSVGALWLGTAGKTPTGEEVASLSGGGFANYSPQPSWQKDAVAKYLGNSTGLPSSKNFNASGRGYPDVAAQGMGFSIVVDGIPLYGSVAGTSCACPSFAGVIALLNDVRLQAGKPPLGFLNPFIYQTAPTHTNSFNDAVAGVNQGCGLGSGFIARAGWDPASGWGSPNYSILSKIVATL